MDAFDACDTISFDLRFKCPLRALIVGASESGKTRLVLSLITRPCLFTPPPKRVFIFYLQYQSIYAKAKSILEKRGVPTALRQGHWESLSQFEGTAGDNTFIFYDDLNLESPRAAELASSVVTSRHARLSLFLTSHTLFGRSQNLRLVSGNCPLLLLLPSPRLQSSIRTLGHQLGLGKRLQAAYSLATSFEEHEIYSELISVLFPCEGNEDGGEEICSHGRVLLLDLHPSCPKPAMLRTLIQKHLMNVAFT